MHYRLATGGVVIKKPKLRTIVTEKAILETSEIELDKDGKAVYVDHWEELSPGEKARAIEWDLRFRDRGTYGDAGNAPTNTDAAGGTVRPSGDVLGTFVRAFELMHEMKLLPASVPAIETRGEAGER
jgi:hypothetical protein